MWSQGTTNATDAVDLNFVNRSKIEDLYTWGVSTCGLRINAGVTDTLIRPHTSAAMRLTSVSTPLSHPTPQSDLCLAGGSGNSSGIQTTNGTVLLTPWPKACLAYGWQLISSNSRDVHSLVPSSTTLRRAHIYSGSKWNTLLAPTGKVTVGKQHGR